MSQKQNKRTTRSSKNNFLIEENVISNFNSMKKTGKVPITSYSLKSSKLKGKCLTTFKKKVTISTPKLTRREFLKGLLKSRMKVVTGKCILIAKCVDSGSILTEPNRKACKDCDVSIHVKCVIDMGLKLEKHYCSHDCMRDDEMINNGYLFK